MESEPPYQYVGGNPVNFADPSGKIPTLEGIERGRYSFSCRCGWIDWGHASPRAARELMTAVRAQVDGGDPVYKGVRAHAEGRFFGVSDIAVVQKNITRDYQTATALGIFMETSEAFENFQGLFRVFGTEITYYPIEDLPSDLIGFYSMLQSEGDSNGLTEEEQKKLIKPLCGALLNEQEDKAWSKKVLQEYEWSGLLYQKNFEWHPNFIVSGGAIDFGAPFEDSELAMCRIVGGCHGKDRQWPSEFRYLETVAIRSHERRTWFWPWQDTEEEAFRETPIPGAYEYYRKR